MPKPKPSLRSQTPIHRRWTSSGPVGRDRAFLLLGHGHFMLRLKEWLVWKPQEEGDEFQVLIASGHDRVFGEMVKAQRAEAKKKEEEEAKKNKKKLSDKDKAQGKPKDRQQGGTAPAPAPAPGAAVAAVGEVGEMNTPEAADVDDAKVMLAVPVKDIKDVPEALKHEQEPKITGPPAAPVAVAAEANQGGANGNDIAKAGVGAGEMKDGEAKGDEVKGKDCEPKGNNDDNNNDNKDKTKVKDPLENAEKLLKAGKGDLKMDDIKAAFQALEAAAGGESCLRATLHLTNVDKCQGQLTRHGRTERQGQVQRQRQTRHRSAGLDMGRFV